MRVKFNFDFHNTLENLTKGKEYVFKRDTNELGYITDDVGDELLISLQKCSHLNGGNWEVTIPKNQGYITPKCGPNLFQARGGKRVPRKLKKKFKNYTSFLDLGQKVWLYTYITNRKYNEHLIKTILT